MTWPRLRAVEAFFFSPQPQHALVTARVLLGGALCCTYAARLPGWALLFGPEGMGGAGFYARFPEAGPWSVRLASPLLALHHVESGALILALLVLLIGASACFACGAFTRTSGALTLLLHALFYGRNPFVYEGSWAEFIHAPLLYVVLSHAGRYASVDARRARARGAPPRADWLGPGWPLRLLQIHTCCMYVAAGWSRLDKQSWLSGDLVFIALSGATHSRFAFDWSAWQPLLSLATWGALVLEVCAPIALWLPVIGHGWALALVGLHLALELATNVGWWQAVMLAGLASFLLPWRRRVSGS